MVENKRVPSPSLSSDNESLEHTTSRVTTLVGGSSIEGEESRGYITSHTIVSQTPSTQLSSRRGCPISPYELNEDARNNSYKRPRGRPLGSRNKPKPPVIIREDDDTILKPTLIEIPRGNDIAETLIYLARHHNANITVLSGFGLVSEFALHDPMSPSPTFPFKGTFNIMSIFGTYINADCVRVSPQFIANPACSCFSIYISGVQGQIFGGIIGGKVMSAGPVIVTATLFKKFHRGAFINSNIERVINIANHTAVEPNNNNGNKNNNVLDSIFGVAGSNSMSFDRQLPPTLPSDVSVMQWNYSTLANSYE